MAEAESGDTVRKLAALYVHFRSETKRPCDQYTCGLVARIFGLICLRPDLCGRAYYGSTRRGVRIQPLSSELGSAFSWLAGLQLVRFGQVWLSTAMELDPTTSVRSSESGG